MLQREYMDGEKINACWRGRMWMGTKLMHVGEGGPF